MENPWFTFSFADFSYAFLSVLLEGVPFILVGTLLSGVIDEFLPSRVMVRLLPRNAFLGICLSGSMGLVFPMCECGVVPVIRRLINKGLPVSNAIAYMLAAPIVNPIVLLSTYAAFRGQNAAEFTLLRLGVGYIVAVIVALAVHNLPFAIDFTQRSGFGGPFGGPAATCGMDSSFRVGSALRVAVTDFLDVMVFFVLGVAISALFSTSVNQELIMPLALNDWIATFSHDGLCGDPFALQHLRCVYRGDLDRVSRRGEAGIPRLWPNVRPQTTLYLQRRVSEEIRCRTGGRSFCLDRLDLRAIENSWAMTVSVQRYLSAGVLTIWGVMLGVFLLFRSRGILPASLLSYLDRDQRDHSRAARCAVCFSCLGTRILAASRVANICTPSRRR